VRKLKVLASLLSLVFLMTMPVAARAQAGGEGVFKAKCVLCHGADGSGNTNLGKQLQAANLRSKEVQKKSDAELHKIVHDGNGNMPPFADQLTDDEINQVIKYIRTLGKRAKK
jgi:cytochrome c6